MALRCSLLVAVFTAVLLATSTLKAAIITTIDGGTIATGIQDLVIDGVHYDVDFTRTHLSFNDVVFGTGDPPSIRVPTFWNDSAGASSARDAIVNLFGEQGFTGNLGTTIFSVPVFDVPYQREGVTIGAMRGSANSAVWNEFGHVNATDTAFWVVFSPAVVVDAAVPEPASLAIWGLGALGWAVAGYRRRKVVA